MNLNLIEKIISDVVVVVMMVQRQKLLFSQEICVNHKRIRNVEMNRMINNNSSSSSKTREQRFFHSNVN